jgi:3-methyladenine DNA glycosylase AlkD
MSRSADQPPAPSVADVVAWIEKTGSPRAAAGLARFGLPIDNSYGISVATLQKYAKSIGTHHELALKLWKTGSLDARILACFLGDPDQLTPAMMDAWCRDFDNWGTTDTACFKLFDQSPHAWKMAPKWVKQKGEFQKRAGFVLIACLAQHDQSMKDAAFVRFVPMIGKGASDDRNFVKKGVSWALRGLGHRSRALHATAIKTANKLATSDNATERWVGKDALKDITRPAVIKKLNRR